VIVDLSTHGFRNLEVHIHFVARPEVLSNLCETYGLKGHVSDERFSYKAVGGFQADENYRVRLRLTATSDPDHGKLTAEYVPTTADVPAKAERILHGVSSVLEALGVPYAGVAGCSGLFPRDRYEPIINIPLLQFRGLPFDDVRGVRLTKSDGTYVILDAPEDDSEAIHFIGQLPFSGESITPELPKQLLGELTKLRKEAVVEVQEQP
jgi:hypothetical protein